MPPRPPRGKPARRPNRFGVAERVRVGAQRARRGRSAALIRGERVDICSSPAFLRPNGGKPAPLPRLSLSAPTPHLHGGRPGGGEGPMGVVRGPGVGGGGNVRAGCRRGEDRGQKTDRFEKVAKTVDAHFFLSLSPRSTGGAHPRPRTKTRHPRTNPHPHPSNVHLHHPRRRQCHPARPGPAVRRADAGQARAGPDSLPDVPTPAPAPHPARRPGRRPGDPGGCGQGVGGNRPEGPGGPVPADHADDARGGQREGEAWGRGRGALSRGDPTPPSRLSPPSPHVASPPFPSAPSTGRPPRRPGRRRRQGIVRLRGGRGNDGLAARAVGTAGVFRHTGRALQFAHAARCGGAFPAAGRQGAGRAHVSLPPGRHPVWGADRGGLAAAGGGGGGLRDGRGAGGGWGRGGRGGDR